MSINTQHEITFLGTKCFLEFGEYSNGRIAIKLMYFDPDMPHAGALPFTVATVNLPDKKLNKDEVFIKNYSENEGLLNILIENKIVSEPIDMVSSGFVTIPQVKLLIPTQ